MSYENSLACKVLATACCVCGRPLVDSVSVEFGIGPICREKYGYNDPCSDADRKRANQLVWQAAVDQKITAEIVQELLSLGFGRLAAKLAARIGDGSLEVTEGECDGVQGYWLKAPYKEEANSDYYKAGAKWKSAKKARFFKPEDKNKVWALIKTHFAGAFLKHPAGECVINGS